MPKTISELLKKVIEETDATNKKRREVEVTAKSDSIVGASKSKLKGENVYIQRRKGNEEANKTRTKSGAGNPLVGLYKNPHQYSTYEKHTGEKDAYVRDEKLEKEMPYVNTAVADKSKKSTKAFIKPSGKLASN
jgi:hypothetical protein